MTHQQKSFRRGPVLATAAALGVAATAVLTPAAHADTDLDRPEESSSASLVGPDSAEVAGVLGHEAVVEIEVGGTGDGSVAEPGADPVVETGQGLSDAGAALPASADEAEEAAAEDNPVQDELCVDGAVNGVPGEQSIPATGDPAAPVIDLDEGTAEEGSTEEIGLVGAAATGEGAVADVECAATTPGQADQAPGAPGSDEVALPVGGVDAGIGEAAGQDMVLPVLVAGTAAAAIALGAYTLVRRSRSSA